MFLKKGFSKYLIKGVLKRREVIFELHKDFLYKQLSNRWERREVFQQAVTKQKMSVSNIKPKLSDTMEERSGEKLRDCSIILIGLDLEFDLTHGKDLSIVFPDR